MIQATRRLLFSTLTVLALVACNADKPKFNAIDITGADYAKGFTLMD